MSWNGSIRRSWVSINAGVWLWLFDAICFIRDDVEMSPAEWKRTYSRRKCFIDVLLKNPDRADWPFVSRCKWATPLMQLRPKSIVWANVPHQPWALDLIRTNDDIDWKKLARSKFADYARDEFGHMLPEQDTIVVSPVKRSKKRVAPIDTHRVRPHKKRLIEKMCSLVYTSAMIYAVCSYNPPQVDSSVWCVDHHEWYSNSSCEYRYIPLLDNDTIY